MKKKLLSSINFCHGRQQGGTLAEAMIGLALSAVLILGAMYASSKSLVSQRNMRLQEIVIDQLRSKLISDVDLCVGSPTVTLPDGESLDVTVMGCGDTTAISVFGSSVVDVPAPLSLTVESDKLGGTVRVGTTWASL